eukprot:CAMPEP_0194346126 /NCGR_PEP_ID=MMETSP0171-20130528/105245_1 /TAXON_ID=218684 /ORGANISM="Corethron pennatum, Strain L29A3" /LENGTH=460 /DNA_ID=CAMNT_0039113209 /DNA_START=309 /DNA_END=1688 /DNA_ORIENTATION=-
MANEASVLNKKKRASEAENKSNDTGEIPSAFASASASASVPKGDPVVDSAHIRIPTHQGGAVVINNPLNTGTAIPRKSLQTHQGGEAVINNPLNRAPSLYLTDVKVVDAKVIEESHLKKSWVELEGKKLRLAVFIFCLVVAIAVGVVLRTGQPSSSIPPKPSLSINPTIKCGTSVAGDTVGTDKVVMGSCGGISSTPPLPSNAFFFDGTGEVITFSTCNRKTDSSAYNSRIRVYRTGQAEEGICVEGNDDNSDCEHWDKLSTVSLKSDENVRYTVLVDGPQLEGGNFQIDVTCVPVPAEVDDVRLSSVVPTAEGFVGPTMSSTYLRSQKPSFVPSASSNKVFTEFSITHVSGVRTDNKTWALNRVVALDGSGSIVETPIFNHRWLSEGETVTVNPTASVKKIAFSTQGAFEVILTATWVNSNEPSTSFQETSQTSVVHWSSQPRDGGDWTAEDNNDHTHW